MYKCLKQQSYEGKDHYSLETIRAQDMESIRVWRNQQIDILRQRAEISAQAQKTYFEHMIWPSLQAPNPHQILFSFLHKGICIGYGGLTHVDWENKRAEISFLIDPKRVAKPEIYVADLSHFLNLIKLVAFDELHFHRLFTETFAFRHEHIAILESEGFQLEGRLRDHVFKKGVWHDSLIHGCLGDLQ